MDNYRILQVIGEGTYGKVFKAQDKITGHVVAIKKFKQREDEDAHVRKTMMREIKVLKEFTHINIVNLKNVFRENSKLHLIFDYIPKTLLEELQQSQNGLEFEKIKSITYQILRSTNFLHENNIIHRDIKPENLLISTNGVVKLCDFGFARQMNSSATYHYTDYVSTRWYRAPELLVGDANYNQSVDVWAIGCIFAEIYNGMPLFPGDSDLHTLQLILETVTADDLTNEKEVQELSKKQRVAFRLNPSFEGLPVPQAQDSVKNLETAKEVSYKALVKNIDDLSLDFLRKCLVIDGTSRTSVAELLIHPLFDEEFRRDFDERLEKLEAKDKEEQEKSKDKILLTKDGREELTAEEIATETEKSQDDDDEFDEDDDDSSDQMLDSHQRKSNTSSSDAEVSSSGIKQLHERFAMTTDKITDEELLAKVSYRDDSNQAEICSKDDDQVRKASQISSSRINKRDLSQNTSDVLSRSQVSHTSKSKRPSCDQSQRGRKKNKIKKSNSDYSEEELDQVFAFNNDSLQPVIGDSTFSKTLLMGKKRTDQTNSTSLTQDSSEIVQKEVKVLKDSQEKSDEQKDPLETLDSDRNSSKQKTQEFNTPQRSGKDQEKAKDKDEQADGISLLHEANQIIPSKLESTPVKEQKPYDDRYEDDSQTSYNKQNPQAKAQPPQRPSINHYIIESSITEEIKEENSEKSGSDSSGQDYSNQKNVTTKVLHSHIATKNHLSVKIHHKESDQNGEDDKGDQQTQGSQRSSLAQKQIGEYSQGTEKFKNCETAKNVPIKTNGGNQNPEEQEFKKHKVPSETHHNNAQENNEKSAQIQNQVLQKKCTNNSQRSGSKASSTNTISRVNITFGAPQNQQQSLNQTNIQRLSTQPVSQNNVALLSSKVQQSQQVQFPSERTSMKGLPKQQTQSQQPVAVTQDNQFKVQQRGIPKGGNSVSFTGRGGLQNNQTFQPLQQIGNGLVGSQNNTAREYAAQAVVSPQVVITHGQKTHLGADRNSNVYANNLLPLKDSHVSTTTSIKGGLQFGIAKDSIDREMGDVRTNNFSGQPIYQLVSKQYPQTQVKSQSHKQAAALKQTSSMEKIDNRGQTPQRLPNLKQIHSSMSNYSKMEMGESDRIGEGLITANNRNNYQHGVSSQMAFKANTSHLQQTHASKIMSTTHQSYHRQSNSQQNDQTQGQVRFKSVTNEDTQSSSQVKKASFGPNGPQIHPLKLMAFPTLNQENEQPSQQVYIHSKIQANPSGFQVLGNAGINQHAKNQVQFQNSFQSTGKHQGLNKKFSQQHAGTGVINFKHSGSMKNSKPTTEDCFSENKSNQQPHQAFSLDRIDGQSRQSTTIANQGQSFVGHKSKETNLVQTPNTNNHKRVLQNEYIQNQKTTVFEYNQPVSVDQVRRVVALQEQNIHIYGEKELLQTPLQEMSLTRHSQKNLTNQKDQLKKVPINAQVLNNRQNKFVKQAGQTTALIQGNQLGPQKLQVFVQSKKSELVSSSGYPTAQKRPIEHHSSDNQYQGAKTYHHASQMMFQENLDPNTMGPRNSIKSYQKNYSEFGQSGTVNTQSKQQSNMYSSPMTSLFTKGKFIQYSHQHPARHLQQVNDLFVGGSQNMQASGQSSSGQGQNLNLVQNQVSSTSTAVVTNFNDKDSFPRRNITNKLKNATNLTVKKNANKPIQKAVGLSQQQAITKSVVGRVSPSSNQIMHNPNLVLPNLTNKSNQNQHIQVQQSLQNLRSNTEQRLINLGQTHMVSPHSTTLANQKNGDAHEGTILPKQHAITYPQPAVVQQPVVENRPSELAELTHLKLTTNQVVQTTASGKTLKNVLQFQQIERKQPSVIQRTTNRQNQYAMYLTPSQNYNSTNAGGVGGVASSGHGPSNYEGKSIMKGLSSQHGKGGSSILQPKKMSGALPYDKDANQKIAVDDVLKSGFMRRNETKQGMTVEQKQQFMINQIAGRSPQTKKTQFKVKTETDWHKNNTMNHNMFVEQAMVKHHQISGGGHNLYKVSNHQNYEKHISPARVVASTQERKTILVDVVSNSKEIKRDSKKQSFQAGYDLKDGRADKIDFHQVAQPDQVSPHINKEESQENLMVQSPNLLQNKFISKNQLA